MDANQIQQLISNLGFPIVACCALFWNNIKTSEAYNKTMEEMRSTIDKNTEAINSILNKLRDDD